MLWSQSASTLLQCIAWRDAGIYILPRVNLFSESCCSLMLQPRPAQDLGLRPHQKTKFPLGKNASLSMIKGLNIYKITYIYIYIYFKGCAFFFISDVKNITNFTIGLQITMLLITKK